MNLRIYKTIFFLFILLSCLNQVKAQQYKVYGLKNAYSLDSVAVIKYLNKYKLHLPEQETAIFFISGGCYKCIKPYFTVLFNYLNKRKHIVISDLDFYKNALTDFKPYLKKLEVDSIYGLETQRFMKANMCMVIIEHAHVKSLNIISKSNIDSYK